MATLVSKPAPDFGAQAVMPDGSFEQLELSSYKGKYVVLFFIHWTSHLFVPQKLLHLVKNMQSLKKEIPR